MINWKVRLKNRTFWLTMIPAVILLVQAVAPALGIDYDFGELGNRIMPAVNAVFTILTMMGVIVDPTTEGIGDSRQALKYEEPKEDL